MRITFLVLILFLFSESQAQSYKRLHRKAIVIDTHNDILMKAVEQGVVFDTDLTGKTDSDLARWKKGGLDVQVFSVYCDGDVKNPFAFANREMDSLDAVVARNPNRIAKAGSYAALQTVVKNGQLAAVFGVEGGHMIEDDLQKLEILYNRGARYLTLTHNISPSWATSAMDEASPNPSKGGALDPVRTKGLNDFGKQVVQRMNQLGMIIDVSHAGEQTFWDVISITKKPIMASHSSVYKLVPHRRNLKDEQIKAIAKNGGVVQINFHPGFIDSSFQQKENAFLKRHAAEKDSLEKTGMGEFYAVDHLYMKYAAEASLMKPAFSLLMDHIEYVIKLVGVDYVGLGSDFDGINLKPQQLDDVTSYPLITKELVKRGYSKKEIYKILGGNFLRVLRANEKK